MSRPAHNTVLRQWNGPLSEELRLGPAGFGLGRIPARLNPDVTTRAVCGYCSTGCSLDIHLKDGIAVNLTPTVEYPVNLGMACPKGWEALAPLSAPDRVTDPLVRAPDGTMTPVSWDAALKLFVGKFRSIMAEHGPESVAFLSTGQMCTEEMALLGCLWKFGMGAVHGDSNTRQCMATTHVAYKQSFGFDAPPFSYADFEASDVLVFIGANPCIAHPILWQRVLANRKQPKIVVIDPRRTETAANAGMHLGLKPKSDLTLFYGIAHLLIRNGWINREFIERSTTGFAGFAEFVRRFTPDKTASETGLTVGQLYRFAEQIHRGTAVSFWWTMGVNQGHESTRTAQAIINLALITGNIGRPGTGANSITGQCNAMGSRLFSNITSLVGGRDFLQAEHRAQTAALLGLPADAIPAQPSLAYDQILERAAEGRIKALWIIGTNPMHSWIGRGRRDAEAPGAAAAQEVLPFSEAMDDGVLGAAFDRLEFLVVQDMFRTTETAKCGDLVLPAAGWGEKEGTFINSERRIGVVKKISRAPGNALSDFSIFRLVAEYWGCGERFAEWATPEAAFQILKRVSAGQPCDITGIRDYRHLDESGGIQWPLPDSRQAGNGDMPAERRLFEDGRFFTPDGRARILFDLPRAVGEPADAMYPFVLLTGRGTSAQWHTNTRTGKSEVLRTMYPENAYVELNPSDAAALKVAHHDRVIVRSRRGRAVCAAVVTASIAPGQVFIPMHYDAANRLTRPEFDPHSRQPGYKHCAVRIELMTP